MNLPNNIVIDNIPNEHIAEVHQMLDKMREQFNVRVRIKKDGRTSSSLEHLPPAVECYEETA